MSSEKAKTGFRYHSFALFTHYNFKDAFESQVQLLSWSVLSIISTMDTISRVFIHSVLTAIYFRLRILSRKFYCSPLLSCEVIYYVILDFLPKRPHCWRACVSIISIADESITKFPLLSAERLAIERADSSASSGVLEFVTDSPGVIKLRRNV